jgi:oxygen-dependent protoporphyrinogen oxidase
VKRVVVVGGGISGLSTAHAVLEQSPSAELVLFEERPQVGGSIVTLREAGYLLDGGPDSWVANKPQATLLAKKLGLEGELIGTIAANRRAFIAWGDRLHPLPEGFVLGVPTSILPIVTTGLFSPAGKLRMAMEPFVRRRRPASEDDDESIDAFVRRRLGGEVAERLVAPLLGGIYGGNAAELSMRATLPQFVDMEAKHGSLIHAMKAVYRPRGGGSKPSMFTSLRGGLGTLVERLVERIGSERVRTGSKVVRVSTRTDDPRGRFAVEVEGAATTYADDVVMSCPAHVTVEALDGPGELLAPLLSAMPYVSTGVVMLGFSRADVAHPLDATGYIVPHVLGDAALAATWVSSKWEDRAPEGDVLIRVFLGGEGRDDLVASGDAELIRLAREELRRRMKLDAEPRMTHVFRFLRANPQPKVGHPGRMRKVREILSATPGLHLVASGYDGVGIPDCVRQAEAVARVIAG